MENAIDMNGYNMNAANEWEESIQDEINYYTCCLDEIRDSTDPEYRALFPIYESLLSHRRRQLQRFTASHGTA